MLSSENVLGILLSGFEGGFGFTPWETSAQFSFSPDQMLPVQEQDQAQGPARAQATTQSGSDELNRDEERRIRRMISNRESARRSRMRKQRHLEDLRNRADRLRLENQELKNRVGVVTRHCLLFCRDNDRLRSEATELRRRLNDMKRVLMLRQLQRLVSPPGLGSNGASVHGAKLQPRTIPVYGGGFTTGTGQTLLV